jgi:Mn2+/Fe2+ NRAMP family transporter
MLVSNNKKVMGDKVNGVGTNIVGWAAAVVMFAAGIGMLVTLRH